MNQLITDVEPLEPLSTEATAGNSRVVLIDDLVSDDAVVANTEPKDLTRKYDTSAVLDQPDGVQLAKRQKTTASNERLASLTGNMMLTSAISFVEKIRKKDQQSGVMGLLSLDVDNTRSTDIEPFLLF